MAHPDPILPVRALPRSEIEVSGSRVLVDAKGGEIAYVPFDEDAEYLERAVNAFKPMQLALCMVADAIPFQFLEPDTQKLVMDALSAARVTP